MTLKVVELFAGIGAQAQALENLGIDYESIVCEIDKYAYQSYCAIHGETENLGDICEVRQLPDCDLLTYSFPCQDLSQAGNMKGMSKDSGTRSSLLWEVGRLLTDAVERERAPAVLLMENVPQVHGKKNLADWNAWLEFLDSLGYTNSYADLNAMDYGVPQSRIRCFMVSTRDGSHYQFPKGRKLDRCLKDVLETDVDESFYLSEKSIQGYQRRKADHVSRGVNFGWEPTEGEGVARCINTVPQKDCQNFIKVTGDLNKKGWLDKSNRVYDPEGVAPSCCAHASDAIAKIEVAGRMGKYEYGMNDKVYGLSGAAPTVIGSRLNNVPRIEVAGEMTDTKVIQARRVYSDKGVSPAVTDGGGTGSLIKVEESEILIKNPVTGKEYPGKDGFAMRLSNPGGEGPVTNPKVAFTVKACVKDGVIVKDNDYIPEMEEGEVCAMHTPSRAKRQQGPRCKTDGTAFTVTCQDRDGVAMNDQGRLRIRYLTPLECWRLMGFSDEAYSRAKAIGTSKTQLYKQAGNSIVVDVLMAIFKPLYIEKKKGQPTLEAWF